MQIVSTESWLIAVCAFVQGAEASSEADVGIYTAVISHWFDSRKFFRTSTEDVG